MAYGRKEFKNKAEEHLTGALLEFYKARLARKAGETKWVEHWETEVTRLIERALTAVLLHPIRGFRERRKALAESIDSLRMSDVSFRRAAMNIVKRDFKLTKVKAVLEDRDREEFWARVARVVDDVLE